MEIYRLYKPDYEGGETLYHFDDYKLTLKFARTFYPNATIYPEDKIENNKNGYNQYQLGISKINVLNTIPSMYINYLIQYDSDIEDFKITENLITEEVFDEYNYEDQYAENYISIYEKIENLNNVEKRRVELLNEIKDSLEGKILKTYFLTNKGYIEYKIIKDNFNFHFDDIYLYKDKNNNILKSETIIQNENIFLLNKIDENNEISKRIAYYQNKNEIIFPIKKVICYIENNNIKEFIDCNELY